MKYLLLLCLVILAGCQSSVSQPVALSTGMTKEQVLTICDLRLIGADMQTETYRAIILPEFHTSI